MFGLYVFSISSGHSMRQILSLLSRISSHQIFTNSSYSDNLYKSK